MLAGSGMPCEESGAAKFVVMTANTAVAADSLSNGVQELRQKNPNSVRALLHFVDGGLHLHHGLQGLGSDKSSPGGRAPRKRSGPSAEEAAINDVRGRRPVGASGATGEPNPEGEGLPAGRGNFGAEADDPNVRPVGRPRADAGINNSSNHPAPCSMFVPWDDRGRMPGRERRKVRFRSD